LLSNLGICSRFLDKVGKYVDKLGKKLKDKDKKILGE
jgi:hypothetical protein